MALTRYGSLGGVEEEKKIESPSETSLTSTSSSVEEEVWLRAREDKLSIPHLASSQNERPLNGFGRTSMLSCSLRRIAALVVIGFLLVGSIAWMALFKRSSTVWKFAESLENPSYHYIVVGGGPSGIVAATELALTFPDLNILMLESGTQSQSGVLHSLENSKQKRQQNSMHHDIDERFFVDDTDYLNQFDVPLMWSGVASSQGRKSAMSSMTARESWSGHHWPVDKTLMARALGGGGLHNAMIHVRALSSDFDKWNITGWSFDDLLPHYMALENFMPDTAWKENETIANWWRGRDGPIATVLASSLSVDSLAPRFVEAAVAAGFPLAEPGFNSVPVKERIGAGYYEFNVRHGVRDSVAQALLGTRMIPPNLEIQTGRTVTRVLTKTQPHGKPPRTIGVEFVNLEGGAVEEIHLVADDEHAQVILAAGAIMTPQLLVNSGIGPDGGVVDLPAVGKGLRDHPVVSLAFSITPEVALEASSIYTVADEMEDYFLSVMQLRTMDQLDTTSADSLTDQLGPLGTAGFSAGAFLRSPWADDDGSPDLQLTVFPRSIEPHVLRETREKVAYLRSHVMQVTVAILQPEARYQVRPGGSLRGLVQGSMSSFQQNSNQTKDLSPLARVQGYRLPSIELQDGRSEYLSSRDVERLAWGMEQVRLIQASQPLADVIEKEVFPGSDVTGQALRDLVRKNHLPNSHWASSARMGTDRATAVVNERLSVYGVQGLRVVDASVFPDVPNGNTHSTVTVVASRGAQLIAEDRRKE